VASNEANKLAARFLRGESVRTRFIISCHRVSCGFTSKKRLEPLRANRVTRAHGRIPWTDIYTCNDVIEMLMSNNEVTSESPADRVLPGHSG
jgi:hypothetical protein